jgi:signal recognition particle GTPase
VDGIILTKCDCFLADNIGGVLSAINQSGYPISFIGVGQRYGDLLPFDNPYWIAFALLL